VEESSTRLSLPESFITKKMPSANRKGPSPKVIPSRAGPENFAVKTQADELPIGPRAKNAAIVVNGSVLGRAENFGSELPDRFRHEPAALVFELEEQAAGVVAASQENSSRRPSTSGDGTVAMLIFQALWFPRAASRLWPKCRPRRRCRNRHKTAAPRIPSA
jgi:hypothetical protein